LPPAPRPGRRYHWGGPPNYRASGMGQQLVTFNPELQLIITRLGDPFGLTFDGSEFINMVLASVIGDKGSWNQEAYEAHKIDNAPPVEEQELVEFLKKNGFESGPNGEITHVEGAKGWYQMASKLSDA